jgi:hypothetical protein
VNRSSQSAPKRKHTKRRYARASTQMWRSHSYARPRSAGVGVLPRRRDECGRF